MNLLTDFRGLDERHKTMFVAYLLGYIYKIIDNYDKKHIEDFMKELKK